MHSGQRKQQMCEVGARGYVQAGLAEGRPLQCGLLASPLASLGLWKPNRHPMCTSDTLCTVTSSSTTRQPSHTANPAGARIPESSRGIHTYIQSKHSIPAQHSSSSLAAKDAPHHSRSRTQQPDSCARGGGRHPGAPPACACRSRGLRPLAASRLQSGLPARTACGECRVQEGCFCQRSC